MTKAETTLLQAVSEKVTEIREAQAAQAQTCVGCREQISELKLRVDGNPGDPKSNPGLVADVADLKKSRAVALIGIKALWLILSAVVGAGATALVRMM